MYPKKLSDEDFLDIERLQVLASTKVSQKGTQEVLTHRPISSRQSFLTRWSWKTKCFARNLALRDRKGALSGPKNPYVWRYQRDFISKNATLIGWNLSKENYLCRSEIDWDSLSRDWTRGRSFEQPIEELGQMSADGHHQHEHLGCQRGVVFRYLMVPPPWK